MNKDSISSPDIRAEIDLTIDEIAQRGAQRMLAVALEAEVEAYLAQHTQKDEQGYAQEVVARIRQRETATRENV